MTETEMTEREGASLRACPPDSLPPPLPPSSLPASLLSLPPPSVRSFPPAPQLAALLRSLHGPPPAARGRRRRREPPGVQLLGSALDRPSISLHVALPPSSPLPRPPAPPPSVSLHASRPDSALRYKFHHFSLGPPPPPPPPLRRLRFFGRLRNSLHWVLCHMSLPVQCTTLTLAADQAGGIPGKDPSRASGSVGTHNQSGRTACRVSDSNAENSSRQRAAKGQ